MTRRVGVEVETSTIHSSIPPAVPGAGTAFIVGICEKGPLDEAILLENMVDYNVKCGVRTTTDTIFDAATVFFREGGKRAYVARVAGTTPVKALLVLMDGSAATGLATLRIEAANEGAWGNGLNVAIVTGTKVDTFRIVVTDDAAKVLVDRNNLVSPAAAVLALSANRWVRAVDLATITAAPLNNPRVLAATTLAGGDDDLDTVIDETKYLAALTLFTEELGAGVIIIPGLDGADITSGLATHCEASQTRIALVSPPLGNDESQAVAAGAAMLDTGDEWVGMIWPWVGYVDGAINRWVDPVAFAAGCRARAQAQGAWQAPSAYPFSRAQFVTLVEQKLGRANINTLAAASVNGIARRGTSLDLRAWFPLTEDVDYPTLAVRDLLNVITADLTRLLDESTVWQAIDGHGTTVGKATGLCIAYLEGIRAAGGLYEGFDGTTMTDPGFLVQAVLTPESLEENELHIRVSVRPAPHAALVVLGLIKVGVGTPLT